MKTVRVYRLRTPVRIAGNTARTNSHISATHPQAQPSMRRTAERYGSVPPGGTKGGYNTAFPQVNRLYRISARPIPESRTGYTAKRYDTVRPPSRRDSRVTSDEVTVASAVAP